MLQVVSQFRVVESLNNNNKFGWDFDEELDIEELLRFCFPNFLTVRE